MKAVQMNAYGGTEVFVVKNDIPEPSPGPHQVLVKVRAVSINPFDYKLREGYMKQLTPLKLPVTVGGDFAGIVAQLGNDVTDLKVGDNVYGSAHILNGGSGAFAEYTVSNAKNTSLRPKTSDFEESAALTLVGSSAVQALEEHIKPHTGQKILIHGGAGGIGHIAIQLAKAIGAYVAATASQADRDFVITLGADQVIDYRSEQFDRMLKDFDAVFDTVGGETMNRSLKVLKKGGILVSMLSKPDEPLLKLHNVTAIRQGTKTNASHLKRLAEYVDQGKIHVNIDKVFPFSKVKEAFAYQEHSHPRGKVVVKIA